MPNLGCRGAESPGWFDILQKNSAWEVKHEQVHCHDEAANHHLPIAVAFWIIWIGYVEECWNLTQNLMQIRWSAPSVILNVMATQYICSLHGVYCPHWWVEWSHHCSHLHIPVHSLWLPGYINVVQTILVILTMAGVFLDRPHILYLFNHLICQWVLGLLLPFGYCECVCDVWCTNICLSPCFLWYIYEEVKLLNHMIILFLIFWRFSILFSP